MSLATKRANSIRFPTDAAFFCSRSPCQAAPRAQQVFRPTVGVTANLSPYTALKFIRGVEIQLH